VNAWSRGSLLLIGLAFLAPRLTHAEEAAEVTCKDGTKSKAGKGACSGHGGVDKSASKSAAEPPEKSASSSKSKTTSASASSAAAPATAEAAEVTCKDGTTSHAGKGACSGHGGVDKSASASKSGGKAPAASAPTGTSAESTATAPPEPAPPRSAPAASASTATGQATKTPAAAGQKGPPTAKCKDGSLSYAQHHTGACSNHGGVAEWLDSTQK